MSNPHAHVVLKIALHLIAELALHLVLPTAAAYTLPITVIWLLVEAWRHVRATGLPASKTPTELPPAGPSELPQSARARGGRCDLHGPDRGLPAARARQGRQELASC